MIMLRSALRALGRAIATPVLVAGLLAAQGAMAQDGVESFYKGRTVGMVVGFNTGGAYDLYARVVARHMPKHMPGKPGFVVKNMQGAGSVIAANFLYNRSPRDGSEIGLIAGTAALEPLFGGTATQFDGQKFSWLGSVNEEVGACFTWHASKTSTPQQLMRDPVIIGSAGTSSLLVPSTLNAVLGANLRIVKGYKGTSDLLLALERGEVEGMCGMLYGVVQAERPDWLDKKLVNVLMQVSVEHNTKLGDAPSIMDFATSDDQRSLLRLLIGWTIMGRPFLAPPGVPKDRATALRAAFVATMKDEDFLQDAARNRLDVSPITAAEIERFLAESYATPQAVVNRAAKIMKEAN
jgi:tripartite-type tricarboxylate transporter receptor subunit TctC